MRYTFCRKMKNLLHVIVLCIVVSASVMGQDPETDLGLKINKAAGLLKNVQSHYQEFSALVKIRESRQELSPEQLERFKYLSEESSVAYSCAREIIAMLEPGNSVFHYPGLLLMGRLTYQPYKKEYTLDIQSDIDKSVSVEFSATGTISRLRRIEPIR